jgi:excisionase family DNA binding protein
MDHLLLRPEQAAQELGISRSKLYAMLATGELPSITIGRSRRVVAADLSAWVEQQREAAHGA